MLTTERKRRLLALLVDLLTDEQEQPAKPQRPVRRPWFLTRQQERELRLRERRAAALRKAGDYASR